MRLTAKNKKLTLYCPFENRHFPKSLKGRYEKLINAYTWPPSKLMFIRILEEAALAGLEVAVDPRLTEHYSVKAIPEVCEGTYESKTVARDFQSKTIKFGVSLGAFFALLDPGLGKTKISIDFVGEMISRGNGTRALVVSPNRLMINYASEISKHSDFDSVIIQGTLSDRRYLMEHSKTTFHIINYDILSKMVDSIHAANYDMVIFDEIHMCKSHTSSRSKAAYEIAKDIPYKVGLSGTIILNNPVDIFMPYKIIHEGTFGPHITQFKSRYAVMGGFFDKEIKHMQREEELHRLIASRAIRFKLRDVAPELPDSIEQDVIVELDKATMDVYKAAKNKMIIELSKDNDRSPIAIKNCLEKILRLRQIASGFTIDESGQKVIVGDEKLGALMDIVSGINGKVVVFCAYDMSVDRIADRLKKDGISYIIFDGRTKQAKQGDIPPYDKFNFDDTRVMVTKLQMGVGYSIPNCKYSIFFELDYSRLHYEQCRGRTLRIVGSEQGSCVYINLMATKTIDIELPDVLNGKTKMAEYAMRYIGGFNVDN
ncbi:SSL2 DNA or RNA helicases of superfamily II [uncultured Caudovirales phage]|uniref:SSL2 DNA or RNA helicases of superfamily II n=1 Tax=uncultured Caudovirales phage TaxID=2100421 RepID=A0A6J5Q9A6_9CAUD|nr:SSL2 DNA or RNA helicases of superfamily II [uncultured Caudovirales phage]